MTRITTDLQFRPSGDTGLTVVLGDTIGPDTSARVMQLKAQIDVAALAGVIETVPTYVSLLVHYRPLATSQAELISAISRMSETTQAEASAEGRHWTLPVCFDGGDLAPDLPFVADWARLSPDEVVRDITEAEQVVYMLGFAPGLPYLGDLPERIAIPRREDPVARVPAGSVLVATGKTVIYPVANPTGWYVVGRTPVRLFDLDQQDPVLLRPGDRVRLRQVSRAEFDDLSARIADGRYDPRREALS